MYPDHETFLRGYCRKIIPEFRFSKAMFPGATRFAIDFVFDPPRDERGLQMRMTGTTYKNGCNKTVGWHETTLLREIQEAAAGICSGLDVRFGFLVLLFASLFATTLASERLFHALLFAGLQVVGVTLHLFDDVLLLDLALKPTQGVL